MIQWMLAIWSLVPLPLRASVIGHLVKNPPAMQEIPLQCKATHSTVLGFSCGSAGKESTCSVGDWGSIPRLGRSPREGKGYPLQYSDLKNSRDYIVHGVAKSRTGLSDFHFHFPLPFLRPAWRSGSSWFMYCWSLAWRILSTLYSLSTIYLPCLFFPLNYEVFEGRIMSCSWFISET